MRQGPDYEHRKEDDEEEYNLRKFVNILYKRNANQCICSELDINGNTQLQ